jgi:F420-non-reducing hydrogenase iron-sulfur subunit
VAATEPRITAFVCANCRRAVLDPSAAVRSARLPVLPWPAPVQEIAVPCAGRLQPEHLLKAFEAGADLVCVVACNQDNCHHLEGSRRAARRSAFVQGLLDEIGSSGDRLLLLHLPGTARQDMAAGLPGAAPTVAGNGAAELAAAFTALAEQVTARLKALPPNPMHLPPETPEPPEAPAGADQAAAGPEEEDQDNED